MAAVTQPRSSPDDDQWFLGLLTLGGVQPIAAAPTQPMPADSGARGSTDAPASAAQNATVLAHAAEFGAYSVGFQLGRGRLDGFTIYLAGNFAGCGALRASHGMAAACAVPTMCCSHVSSSGKER